MKTVSTGMVQTHSCTYKGNKNGNKNTHDAKNKKKNYNTYNNKKRKKKNNKNNNEKVLARNSKPSCLQTRFSNHSFPWHADVQ
eukprot:5064291-Amphidinium_carterae.1